MLIGCLKTFFLLPIIYLLCGKICMHGHPRAITPLHMLTHLASVPNIQVVKTRKSEC